MDAKKLRARRLTKDRLASLLTAGAGSLVLATTVMTAPAAASPPPSRQPVLQRADDVRTKLTAPDSNPQLTDKPATQLAWWRNWGNGGWGPHPYWHNWPNWRNWHNWGNWRNY